MQNLGFFMPLCHFFLILPIKTKRTKIQSRNNPETTQIQPRNHSVNSLCNYFNLLPLYSHTRYPSLHYQSIFHIGGSPWKTFSPLFFPLPFISFFGKCHSVTEKSSFFIAFTNHLGFGFQPKSKIYFSLMQILEISVTLWHFPFLVIFLLTLSNTKKQPRYNPETIRLILSWNYPLPTYPLLTLTNILLKT